MLYIQHNLLAENANRQLGLNTNKNAKTTEKLSSGYKINRAADDAAGLAISEKMRRQVRGLMQGTANAKDGISYVQVADGAMNEGHDILQRMNELAIKSLNGTLTAADRDALNLEFDQLRTEIDRINTDTEFNEQKVFDEHEPSYYQILGNRQWNDNQLHTVSGTENELIINLPDDYVPNEYTLTVPAGIYTTQELVDEIDDALENMTPPNPGFVFEYTDKGYCNLNFESPSGMPTMIESVEGSLAYLIYDLYAGSSSGDLLGTGEFPLQIYAGYNDTLGFYVEGVEKEISMTIPPGTYSRDEMIRKINEELARYPEAAGVTAEKYGDANIRLTGGKGVNITGLKGNMFRWESYTEQYSSAFYDNLQYGISSGGAASITGKAYYSSDTAKISIKTGINDTLCFKLNGSSDYTEIKDIPQGEYTISELAAKLQELFKAKGIDGEITASTSSNSTGTYLILRNTLTGTKSTLEFDTTSKPLYKNTYDSLFRITSYYPVSAGTGKQTASLTGRAYLTGNINLPQNALTFSVDGTSYTLDGLKSSYSGIDELVSELNTKLGDKYSDLKNKIKFQQSSSQLQIVAQTDDITNITISSANQEAIYKQLFTRTETSMNSLSPQSQTGRVVNAQQGTSETIVTDPWYSVAVSKDRQITINSSNNKISFSTSRGDGTISLDAKSYTVESLVNEINRKLHASGNPEGLQNLTASYDAGSGRLIFKSSMPKDYPKYTNYYISLNNTSGSDSAWKDIVGTYDNTYYPSSTSAHGASATLTTHDPIAENTTINGTNNTLTLKLGSGEATINIAQASYTSREALKDAVQKAIDGSALKGKVTVNVTGDNKLRFSTTESKIEASGSFYDSVLISKITRDASETAGSYSYTPAFIIGRKDLTQEPIDIISGANDEFIFDFAYYKTVATYSPLSGTPDQNWSPIKVTIPEGSYNGEEIAAVLTTKIQEAFNAKNLNDFEVKVMVNDPGGTVSTNSEFDKTALKIVVNRKGSTTEPDRGTYVLDGVRGSAATFVFYKTSGTPQATYITGTKDLTNGVTFEPGKNVLTFSADSIPYQYTFPEDTYYTADEFVNLLNGMFENGDDNGKAAPLTAEIENGVLKITHKAVGSHTISDVGGSARSTVFFQEEGRDSRKPLNILVTGETGDYIEIPKISVGTCAIKINSITLSRPKYAEKAVRRIKDAIKLLSSKRSTYGALQNRMEHTVNNNENVIENTQASESAIRDADVADLMMEHSINNILLQAGSSILAQANQNAQLIMGLLR